MKLARALAAASFAIVASSAGAQTRPELPILTAVGGPQVRIPGNGLNTVVNVACESAGRNVNCGSTFPTYVSLSNFATYSELSSLSADLTRARDELGRRADDASALAGATDLMSPADGAENRIGMQAFTIGDSTAVGGSYTRRMGQFDVGAAFATTHERAAGKVSVGFSW